MTVDNMRDAISSVYRTSSWRKKVDYMYDDQVIAIYYKFLKEGKLNKVLKRERPKVKPIVIYEEFEQLSLFDLLDEGGQQNA